MLKIITNLSTEKQFNFTYRYCETLMHLLKGNIGCGMLAMGDAFRNGGLLMAPILTIFIGTVCIYNNHILVSSFTEVKENN